MNITVIQKKPGMKHAPEVLSIPNTLAAKQKLVNPEGKSGSLIERVYAPEFEAQGVEVFCNEEFLFDPECTHNVEIGGVMLQGPIFFTTYNDEGEAQSLTDEQVSFVTAKLRTVVQSIF